MGDKNMADKRHFQRFNIIHEARYTKSQGLVTISALSKTKNISLNGLCSKLSSVISVKDTILVEIKLADKIKVAVLAKVVWVKASPGECRNVCGLKFLWISSQEILDKYIETIGKQAAA
jgi:hypothetical protein